MPNDLMSLDAMPIELANGRGFAWVSPEDWSEANKYPWHLQLQKNSITDYAQLSVGPRCERKTVSLHRFVAERIGLSMSEWIDHVDRNGLNCTRRNLRNASRIENARNRGPNRGTESGLKGVRWVSRRNRWCAEIGIGKKTIHLINHKDKYAAARVYDSWAREAFGEFAYLNFPEFWR